MPLRQKAQKWGHCIFRLTFVSLRLYLVTPEMKGCNMPSINRMHG